MEKDNNSLFEKAVYSLGNAFSHYRVPYITAVLAGLLAYMFAFTNKLVNHDEIMCLFLKGASVSSGRWAMPLVSRIFPDWSMPWLYGAVSLLLLAAAICLMLDLLGIRNKVVQAVLAAIIITFPGQMDTFCYMFTSSAYALSLLMAVLSAWIFARETKGRWIVCPLLLALALGIYQAYLALPASLLVLLLIKRCLDGEDVRTLLRDGVQYVLMLAAGAVLYYAVLLISLKVTGTEFNDYAKNNLSGSFLHGLRVAYTAFLGLFYRGYFGYITPGLSRAMHYVCAFFTAVELIAAFVSMKEGKRRWLLLLLLALFPLSIDCIYLISSTVHTLVLYGFISVYLLAGVLLDGRIEPTRHFEKDIMLLAMALVTLSNVTFANSIYLKQYLQYENAMAFYTSVVTQVKSTEGYEKGCSVAIIGEADTGVFKADYIDDHELAGMYRTLLNVYSRDDFIRYYVGFDVRYATAEEKETIMATEEYQQMASYPYYGSVQKIGDFIVVKLG